MSSPHVAGLAAVHWGLPFPLAVLDLPCQPDDGNELRALQHGHGPQEHRRHPEQAARQKCGPEAYWDSFWEDDDLFYGHVLGFKGLERSAVVLAVNGFQDMARAQHMVYVGMSRARSLLVVVGPREVVEEAAGPRLMAALDAGEAWRPPAG